MNQFKFTTSKGVFLGVEVPEYATKPYLATIYKIPVIVWKCDDEMISHNYLPHSNYTIIGTTSDIIKSEELSSQLIPPPILAISLFESLGMLVVNPYPTPLTCCGGSIQSGCGCMGFPYNYSSYKELDDYYEAQSQIKNYIILKED